MKPNINWIIHLVMNGVRCAECGDVENSFLPFTCNCHTHGMEQYGHPNFQVVINYPDEEIGYILNSLGLRVQAGEKFKNGDYVEGIYEDCRVRMKEFIECNRRVLRVIIPDKHNRFPEDKDCTYPHTVQLLDTEQLMKGGVTQ